MPEPVFTRREMRALTFEEDVYFQGLTEKAEKIAEMLQLGHEEAGILDRKLPPELLHTVAQIVQFLDDPEYREEAERELARQDDPDVALAILRQAFRICSDRVNDLLVRKLTDLCQAEGSHVAREAIREATGSELQRLSQLADEVFLNIGTLAELLQLAADSQRALPIRIRACYLLLEQHGHYPAVPVALKLFADGAKMPTAYELLRRLSNAFGAFESFDQEAVQQQVVRPLLDQLRAFERDVEVRRYLLWALGELHEPVLAHLREIPTWRIGRSDMWLALVLRECAFHSSSAVTLALDWLQHSEVDAHFKLRITIRFKDNRVKYPHGAEEELRTLLDALPPRHADEMRQNLEQMMRNARGERKRRPAGEIYATVLEQYRQEGDVDDDLLWEVRHSGGAMRILHDRMARMDEVERTLLMRIISHERFRGRWEERLGLILGIYEKLSATQKREALSVVYRLASNERHDSRTRQRANTFLAYLIEAGDQDSELARQYWQRLGDQT